MASSFAWLDSSEHEQRRALDVIDLLQQKETVDELGLGSVRDTIADVLSPGTSTIQTRARYFFFIPWTYQGLLKRNPEGKSIGEQARSREVELITALANSADQAGTIGIQSGKALKRLPSAIYWAGLGRLGFRIYQGSRDQYHRAVGRRTPRDQRDDAGDILLDAPMRGDWHPHLPPSPDEFPDKATFALTSEEATFFSSQLEMHARGSLLHFLISDQQAAIDVGFPWELSTLGEMPAILRRWLTDGRNYSELMQGAQLLYGLLLSEKKGVAEWIDEFRGSGLEWAQMIEARRDVHSSWDRSGFWTRLVQANRNLPQGVRLFSEHWIDLVLSAKQATEVFDADAARSPVVQRERELKRSRARVDSRAHLDLWGGGELQQLNYRWYITQAIVRDVVAGLKGRTRDA